MSHQTDDFEELLDNDQITAVNYDEEADVLTIFATDTATVSLDDLRDFGDHDVEVVSAGGEFVPDLLDPDNPPLTAHASVGPSPQDRHRPVKLGSSECAADSTAATGGYFPVKVTDSSKGEYGKDCDGYLVKLSNCHVYADEGNADFQTEILQPSPYDGGTTGDPDDVGYLLGYVDIQDGVTVDAAVRTCNTVQESFDGIGLDHTWPTGIYRGDYDDLKGETLIKTGRTTGVTEGTVLATNATAHVRYSSKGVTKVRDQIATTDMSAGGDSGSPYFTEDGLLVGMGFAGSSKRTLLNKAENIEKELGIQFMHWNENETDA